MERKEITVEELLQRYAAGERDFSVVCLDDADLSGANLAGIDFSHARLRWANLSGAILCGANLSDTDLQRANLTGANLEAANIINTCIAGANLENTNLRGAIGFFGEANGTFLHNTVWPDGEIVVGPEWIDA
ncbi:MAG: pentapeptide repeat-containing protein [Nostoc sp. ChiSLP01]|nr:pentapeptide repeat-containing protein [Nostoc sp. CmiSLP01]MDZ8283897.1 pentapeptide repeat-containing protein [Nostoc sp. ChiSLP01]